MNNLYLDPQIRHTFEPFGEGFIIHCKRTGGSFSTNIWKMLNVMDGRCMCCNETIERRHKK